MHQNRLLSKIIKVLLSFFNPLETKEKSMFHSEANPIVAIRIFNAIFSELLAISLVIAIYIKYK